MKQFVFQSHSIFNLTVVLMLSILAMSNTRQAHAKMPSNDQQIRELLLSADSIKAFIQTLDVYGEEGPTVQVLEEFICDIHLGEMRPLIEDLSMKKSYSYDAANMGGIVDPTLFLVFYKDGKQVGFFVTTYKYSSTFFYEGEAGTFKFYYVVSSQNAYALREYVARNPTLAKALWKAGVRPQDLAPKRALQPDFPVK